MPINRRTTFDDYVEPPRRSTRTSRTSSSRNGGIFGEEVPRRQHIPPSPTFPFAFEPGAYVESRHSSRRYNTEERVPSSFHFERYTRTTTDLGGDRIRVDTYRTEERVPSGHSSHHQSSRRTESSRTYRYAEPEPFRYDAPEEYSYAEADTYEYAEPEFETRPRRSTHGATNGSSRPKYYTEERRPGGSAYEVPPEHSSRSHRAHASSSSRSSRPSKPSGSSKHPEPIGVTPRIDLYTVLGLSRDATSSEIKKAYRTLSMRWHPDRCSEEDKDVATEKMAEINQANDVLGDSEKRAYYDCYRLLPVGM